MRREEIRLHKKDSAHVIRVQGGGPVISEAGWLIGEKLWIDFIHGFRTMIGAPVLTLFSFIRLRFYIWDCRD